MTGTGAVTGSSSVHFDVKLWNDIGKEMILKLIGIQSLSYEFLMGEKPVEPSSEMLLGILL